jgi:hypothetical protein
MIFISGQSRRRCRKCRRSKDLSYNFLHPTAIDRRISDDFLRHPTNPTAIRFSECPECLKSACTRQCKARQRSKLGQSRDFSFGIDALIPGVKQGRPHARRGGPGFVVASENRIGRIRRAVRRAFIASDGEPILARAVIERAFPRVKCPTDWQRWSVRRALLRDAEMIGRMLKGRGRPNLWAPKTEQ